MQTMKEAEVKFGNEYVSLVNVFALRAMSKKKMRRQRAMLLTTHIRRDERTMPDGSREALEISEKVTALLAGHTPELTGAVLAELVSGWIAGHVVFGDAKATDQWRQVRFDEFVDMTRGLLTTNAKVIDSHNAERKQ
jgi:hypothetical protein